MTVWLFVTQLWWKMKLWNWTRGRHVSRIVCVSVWQAGAICSPQGPRSNQSVSGGGVRLISHPSSLPSLVPKTDALGNKANQYTSSQYSPAPRSQDVMSRLSSGTSLVLIRHHHLVYMAVLPVSPTRTHTNKHKGDTCKHPIMTIYTAGTHTRTNHILTPPRAHTHTLKHSQWPPATYSPRSIHAYTNSAHCKMTHKNVHSARHYRHTNTCTHTFTHTSQAVMNRHTGALWQVTHAQWCQDLYGEINQQWQQRQRRPSPSPQLNML